MPSYFPSGGGGGALPDLSFTITYTGTLPPWVRLSNSANLAKFTPGASGVQTGTIMAKGVLGLFTLTGYGNSVMDTLTALSFTDAETTSAVTIGSFNSLLTLDFPALVNCYGSFSPTILPALTSLTAPNLVTIFGNFAPTTMALLTTLTITSLQNTTGGFSPSTMATLTTLSAPSLVAVGSNFAPTTMAALTTFNFPALTHILGNFTPNTMGSLVTCSADALQYVGGSITLTAMASLTAVSLNALIAVGGSIQMTTTLGNLADVTIGSTLKYVGANINLSGQKLTEATVNHILARIAALDGTNGTTSFGTGQTLNLSGGTSSAPTGQGVTDKATIQARGATVTTN